MGGVFIDSDGCVSLGLYQGSLVVRLVFVIEKVLFICFAVS